MTLTFEHDLDMINMNNCMLNVRVKFVVFKYYCLDSHTHTHTRTADGPTALARDRDGILDHPGVDNHLTMSMHVISVCRAAHCFLRQLRQVVRSCRLNARTSPHSAAAVRDIEKSLITANMQSETGFPGSHQLKSYVAPKSCLKLTARCAVSGFWSSCSFRKTAHWCSTVQLLQLSRLIQHLSE